MGSLAVYHAPEADDGRVLHRTREDSPGHLGNLEGPGAPDDVDILPGHAVTAETVRGPVEKPLGDECVEAGDDDSHFSPDGKIVAFNGTMHMRYSCYSGITIAGRGGVPRTGNNEPVSAGRVSGA